MKHTRPFVAEFHALTRRGFHGQRRNYSSLDNAIKGASIWIARHGRVADRVEIYHKITGTQLGVLNVRATGKIESTYIFEKDI